MYSPNGTFTTGVVRDSRQFTTRVSFGTVYVSWRDVRIKQNLFAARKNESRFQRLNGGIFFATKTIENRNKRIKKDNCRKSEENSVPILRIKRSTKNDVN